MESGFHIYLDPLGDTVRVDECSGASRRVKHISLESFLSGVLACTEQRAIAYSGLLPSGCIAYNHSLEREVVCIEYPERYGDITYQETLYERLPLPRLLFKFQYTPGRPVHTCWMAAAGEGRLRPSTPLYRFPFSNVYPDRRICLGRNALPAIDAPIQLQALPELILRMPNNDDLYNPEANRKGFCFRELLEYVREREPSVYYEELLLPDGHTLEQFIS